MFLLYEVPIQSPHSVGKEVFKKLIKYLDTVSMCTKKKKCVLTQMRLSAQTLTS